MILLNIYVLNIIDAFLRVTFISDDGPKCKLQRTFNYLTRLRCGVFLINRFLKSTFGL